MESKWIKYKEEALALRREGISMTVIEKKFGIARSTMSGWFKNIQLTEEQKQKLIANSHNHWKKGREKAVIWHNKQKENRINEAKIQASEILSNLNIKDKNVLEIALAFLYWGEGAKGDNHGTELANSNPSVLKFYIKCLNLLYGIKNGKLKCHLHLRSDQDDMLLKKYWSRELRIPIKNFYKTLVDKRTIKSKTYPNYKGVCVINGGGAGIRRRLGFLSQGFCDKIQELDG